MSFKIIDGTPVDHTADLCKTCRRAVIRRGFQENTEEVVCNATGDYVLFKVRECSKYDDRRRPSLNAMRDIAWVIEPRSKKGAAGFMSPQEREAAGLGIPGIPGHYPFQDD